MKKLIIIAALLLANSSLAATPVGNTPWGQITGTLSNQTDLQTALNGKQASLTTGTTLQYFRGDLSLATFPTNLSAFTNGPGYITNSVTTLGSLSLPYSQLTGTPTLGTAAAQNISYFDLAGAAAAAQAASLPASTVLAATKAAVSHYFLTAYNAATGAFSTAQPSFADISGTLAYSALSGLPTLPVNTTATSNQFFTAYNSVTGAFTSAQPSFSNISGSPSTTQVPVQSLTTTGTSGAATLSSGVLNIPQYSGAAQVWPSSAGIPYYNGTTWGSNLAITTTGTSGAATLTGNTLNIPQYSGMTYPSGTGIAVVTSGTSWGTTLSAPVGTIVGTTDTQTLSNKLLQKRIVTASDATSITPNSSNADITYQLNSQTAGTLTINADVGSPVNGQSWVLKVKSTNVQTFSWNTVYVGGTVALPTALTGGGKIDYMSFIYDSVNSKWDYSGMAPGF